MIDHLSTYATDYVKTKAFYDAVFQVLGYPLVKELTADWDQDFPGRRICIYGEGEKPIFGVVEVAKPATPRHFAFKAASRKAVDQFHEAALAAGGQNNGAPGLRPIYHEHYYGAFVLDPDGNNSEAVYHLPE